MDRRSRKTKEAIYNAFIKLLSKKSYEKITVSEVIETADIGRATFYDHFETKDFLLKGLCTELFDHIFEEDDMKRHIFVCDKPKSKIYDLFYHLGNNDNNICMLLNCESSDLFLNYFKNILKHYVKTNMNEIIKNKPLGVSEEFYVNYITTTLVETAKWWINNGKKETLDEIVNYYLMVIK